MVAVAQRGALDRRSSPGRRGAGSTGGTPPGSEQFGSRDAGSRPATPAPRAAVSQRAAAFGWSGRRLALLPRAAARDASSTGRPARRSASGWPACSRSPFSYVWRLRLDAMPTACASRSSRAPRPGPGWPACWRSALLRDPRRPAATGGRAWSTSRAVAMMALPPRAGIVVGGRAGRPRSRRAAGDRARLGARGRYGLRRRAGRVRHVRGEPAGRPQRAADRRAERDRPAGGRRGARPGRPRPARHPRPLAHRDHGQGRAGRAAAAAGPRPGRRPRSTTWRSWPARRWPTSGRTVGAYRAVYAGRRSWPAPGRRSTRRASTADLPADVDELPPARRELFGWAVREGVTNVVRHSGATTARDPGPARPGGDRRRRAGAVVRRRRPPARPATVCAVCASGPRGWAAR